MGLGVWQQQRSVEESGKAEAVEARAALNPVDYEDLVNPNSLWQRSEHLRFSRSSSRPLDLGAPVAVLRRSQGGPPGAWVLTPLVHDSGVAVPVVRG